MTPPKAPTVENIQPTHTAHKQRDDDVDVRGAGDAQEASGLGVESIWPFSVP
jgi:hypothetical protein